MKNLRIIAIVIMTLMIVACHPKKSADKSIEAVAVKIQKVAYENFAEPVVSTGIITSTKEARLSFKTGGIILRMYAEEGELVQKGKLLATMNMTEIDAQVDQLNIVLDKAKRDYQRASNLLLDSAITNEQWENAGTAMHVAEESLKIASFNRKFSNIYANETGIVIKKIGNEGEVTASGTPVYVINSTNTNDWVIRIGVSDKDWTRIKLKDKAEINLDAYPGQMFNGVVSKIEQAADLSSGTFAVEVQVLPGKFKFANGLIGKVTISPSQHHKFYLIPIDALHEADGQSGNVFSVNAKSKTATIHRVRIAYILKDKVAISSGLQNVPEVITEGGSYLADNSSLIVLQ